MRLFYVPAVLLSLLLAVSSSGCTTIYIRGTAHVDLTAVNRPAESSVSLDPAPSIVTERGVRVSAVSVPRGNAVNLVLENLDASQDVELVWDRSSYAQLDGSSFRVLDGSSRVITADLAHANLPIQNGSRATVDATLIGGTLIDPATAARWSAAAASSAIVTGSLKLVFQRGQESFPLVVPVMVNVRVAVNRPPPVVDEQQVARVSVGTGYVVACWLTVLAYGGSCWAYMAMPTKRQSEEAESIIRQRLETKYGGAARVQWSEEGSHW